MNQQSRLEYIANLCPFIGGEATYLSRGLIHLYNDDIMYDDEDACSSTSYAYRLANPNNNSTKEIKNIYSSTNNAIYPNPASTNLTIEFENKIVNQIKYVVIEDMQGKAIDQINSINENKIILSIQNYSDGLYQVKIRDKNHNLIFVSKLNITK